MMPPRKSARGANVARSFADRYTHLRTGCADRGLRLTPRREVLLRVLSEAIGHPMADVYRGDMHRASRTSTLSRLSTKIPCSSCGHS